jgi:hypothetical protein
VPDGKTCDLQLRENLPFLLLGDTSNSILTSITNAKRVKSFVLILMSDLSDR